MKDIVIKSKEYYLSKLWIYLNSINEKKLFYLSHEPVLQHPADILRSQISNFYECVKKFNNTDDKIQGVKNIFFALDSFYDNCFNILKTFFSNDDRINEKVSYKWFEKNNIKNGKKFYELTNTHHKLFSDCVNLLKHDDPSLEQISLKNEMKDNYLIDGFYFSVLEKTGKRCPHPEIHKLFRGKKTAFSYNFIIKKMIFHLFYYETRLLQVIPKYEVESNLDNRIDIYKELLDIANSISNEFFPNEYYLPSGFLEQNQNSYILNFPKTYAKFASKKYSYILSTEIKINQRTHQANGCLPYFGNKT